MAIKVLVSEQRPAEFYFKVHIDDTKMLADAVTPHPDYVREFHWGKDNAAADIKAEMKRLCQDAAAKMAAPSSVAGIANGLVL